MATEKQIKFINTLKTERANWISLVIDKAIDGYGPRGFARYIPDQKTSDADGNRIYPDGWSKRLNIEALRKAMTDYIQQMPIPADARAASDMIDFLKSSKALDTFWSHHEVKEFLQ